ncbi:MAG TPA: YceI family protein [Steroidobacteraceae bacterium]|nr:YceI family protein [Steroidobacteraceae bacterium]
MTTRKVPLKRAAMLTALAALLGASTLSAEEVHYTLDPMHTYPSFEADHFGVSTWRGKMKHSKGTVTLDRAGHSGTVNITIDPASIDFGLDALNSWAVGPEFLNTSQYPQAAYVGRFTHFNGDVPTQVDGELTLHGITRPVSLTLTSFACKPHPLLKREWCGADAFATFQRDQFGLSAGKDYGFKMEVNLRIQVEGMRDEPKGAK